MDSEALKAFGEGVAGDSGALKAPGEWVAGCFGALKTPGEWVAGHRLLYFRYLERISYREMEGKIAPEFGFEDSPPLSSRQSRIVGFHPHIDAQQQKIQIQPYTQSVGCSQLPVKTIPLEIPSGLRLVIFYRPHVSGIDKTG